MHILRRRRRSNLILNAACVVAAISGMVPRGSALAAVSWTGASGGTNWATGTNWSNGNGPGATDTASFTDTGSTNVPDDLTSALNADWTIGGLTFNDTANHYHTLDLETHTLTINGNLNFNTDQGSTTTTTIRDGALSLGGNFANINVGRSVSSNATAIVDFSGLTSLTATLQALEVGASTAGTANGTLTLSPSNTFTAQQILVGVGSGSGTLNLGASNTILANQLIIGQEYANGAVNIVNGGTVNLGSAAQRTFLQIGSQDASSNTGNTYSGVLNLANAAVNLHLDSLIVGEKNGASGNAQGQLYGGGSGSVAIGDPGARSTWYVGYTPSGGNSGGLVDFSRLDTLQAYVTDFFIGNGPNGSASGTVSLAAANTIDASNSIVVGSGGGSGTLTLGASNTILANQFIIGQDYANGTVNVVNGATVNVGSATQRTFLQIGNQTADSNTGNTYTGILNLGNAAVDLHLDSLIVGQKNGLSGNEQGQLYGGGSGSVAIGDPGARSTWYVGYTPSGGNSGGLVDFSRLNTLQAYITDLFIGNAPSGSASGSVVLAGSNSIDASNSIVVGAGSGTGTLVLGLTNTILANQITIAQDYSNGSVTISSGGLLTLGSSARRANISIAVGTTNTGNTYAGTLDLTNATLIAYLGNVIVGNKNPLSGNEQGTFTISNHADNYINVNTITLGGNQSTGTLSFGGGIMYAGAILSGTGTPVFNWTGGQLSVGTFGASANNFNVSNTGTGILAPGTASGAIGTTDIYGSYTQGAAAGMAIRIAGVAPGTGNDLVVISGAASLAGTLDLSTINDFSPSVGQNFLIATYASHSGAFGFVVPPQLSQGAAFQLDYTTSPTQLMMHIVSPVSANWVSPAVTGTFGTAGNWDTASVPGTTSSLTINNTGGTAKTVTVAASTTVQRIDVSGTAATATLEVPQGIELGVANQLVVGTNGVLSGAGRVFGDVQLNGGVLASYGTVSGDVAGAGAVAPSATLGAGSHSSVTVNTLTTGPETVLQFNLITPGAASVSDRINVAIAGGLGLYGGTVQVLTNPTGAESLGYYKVIAYSGGITGSLREIAMPAVVNNVAYTLDAAHDPGFVDIHRGLLGDANDDGVVNFADFVLLSNNFGATGAGWAGADFNGDGVTNFADFVILSNNFGAMIGSNEVAAVGAASGVPEPASLMLLGAGVLGVFGRRRPRPSGARQAW